MHLFVDWFYNWPPTLKILTLLHWRSQGNSFSLLYQLTAPSCMEGVTSLKQMISWEFKASTKQICLTNILLLVSFPCLMLGSDRQQRLLSNVLRLSKRLNKAVRIFSFNRFFLLMFAGLTAFTAMFVRQCSEIGQTMRHHLMNIV